MTQEEKQLLLQDLCDRLPYGVKIYFGGIPKLLTSITIKTGYIEILVEGEYCKAAYCDFISTYNNTEYLQEEITEKCKPYLRPMSSMTEEEDEWLNDRINFSREDEVGKVRQKWGIVMQEIYTNSIKYDFSNFTEILDWLNSHHFDYRGLITMGLALEAPEDMYHK